MDVTELQLFLDVARLGGFAQAARARNADPSAISRSIAALEREIGVRLFQRTTRRVALTEAGTLFFSRVELLVKDLDSVCDDARALTAGPAGTLRLTASNAFGPTCIAPVLHEFTSRYPAVKLELV